MNTLFRNCCLAMAVAGSTALGCGAGDRQEQEVAPPGAFNTPEEHPVRAELVAEHASIQPGGQTRVGVHFDIEPGWHIYAEDPGDAGLPTRVTWSGPAGAKFTSIEWPRAEKFIDPGDIKTYGYSGSLVVASHLKLISGEGVLTDVPIRARARWLACQEVCLPGSANLELALPVVGDAPALSTHAELFDQIVQ